MQSPACVCVCVVGLRMLLGDFSKGSAICIEFVFCFVFVSLGLLFWHIMPMYCILSIYHHEHMGAYNFF